MADITPGTPGQGNADNLQSARSAEKNKALKQLKEDGIKGNTKEALKELKMHLGGGSTLAALDTGGGQSGDRQSLTLTGITKKFHDQLLVFEKKRLLEFDALVKSGLSWDELLRRIRVLEEKHKKEAIGYMQAVKYAFMALAGSDRKLSKTDFAAFESILDNISEAYNEDNDFREIIVNIQQDKIRPQDYDVICEHITKYEFRKDVSSDLDEVKFNVTGMLISLMNPIQRYQLVMEFSQRTSPQQAGYLAKSLSMANVINLRQYESLMKEFEGQDYQLGAAEEAEIKTEQAKMRRIEAGLAEKMGSPMLINGAERVLNRSTIASLAITGLGFLGMVSNYMTNFNNTKGAKRFLAGLKAPYFLLSTGITAYGVHRLGKGMTAGEHGVGLLTRYLPTPKSAENPFGLDDNAEAQDKYFDELVDITKNHSTIERWLLTKNGFGDLDGFYRKKSYDIARLQAGLFEPESLKKDGRSFLDQFMEYQEGSNKIGAQMIKQAIDQHGKEAVQRYVIRLMIVGKSLGTPSTDRFHTKTVGAQKYTLVDLLRYRQGVKQLPKTGKTA